MNLLFVELILIVKILFFNVKIKFEEFSFSLFNFLLLFFIKVLVSFFLFKFLNLYVDEFGNF